jgi:hypothetical protein
MYVDDKMIDISMQMYGMLQLKSSPYLLFFKLVRDDIRVDKWHGI